MLHPDLSCVHIRTQRKTTHVAAAPSVL